MKRLSLIALILTFVIVPFSAFADCTDCPEPATPPAPERIQFANGEYYILLDSKGEQTNALIILPDKPMMTDRFARYGNIELDPKTGQRSANVKNKGKVTQQGLQVYDTLDRLQDENGFFVFQTVILRYDSVTLVKYDRIEYADYIEQILKVFE